MRLLGLQGQVALTTCEVRAEQSVPEHRLLLGAQGPRPGGGDRGLDALAAQPAAPRALLRELQC